jgi:hypothetical protein
VASNPSVELSIPGLANAAAWAALALGRFDAPSAPGLAGFAPATDIRDFKIPGIDELLHGGVFGGFGHDLPGASDTQKEPLASWQGQLERAIGGVLDFHSGCTIVSSRGRDTPWNTQFGSIRW